MSRTLVIIPIVIVASCLGATAGAHPQNPPPTQQAAPPPPTDQAEGGPGGGTPLRLGSALITGGVWLDASKVTNDVQRETTDTFNVRRARLGIAGNLTPRIGWNLSGDLTAEPVLRNAFVAIRVAKHLTVRVGQANPVVSLERGSSPLALELIDRSHVTSELTGPLDVGVTLFNAEPYRRWLSYALNLNNGAGFNRPDDNDAKDVSGRIAIAPPGVKHLTVVASGTRGEQPLGRRERASVGFDYNGPSFRVMAEGLRQRRDNLPVSDGFFVMTAMRVRPAVVTPNFQMVEFAVRLSVLRDPATAAGQSAGLPSDDGSAPILTEAGIVTTREFHAGVNYYVTSGMRIMTNVVVPIDARLHPGPSIRSRLQIQF